MASSRRLVDTSPVSAMIRGRSAAGTCPVSSSTRPSPLPSGSWTSTSMTSTVSRARYSRASPRLAASRRWAARNSGSVDRRRMVRTSTRLISSSSTSRMRAPLTVVKATPYVRSVTAIRAATVAGLRRLRADWLRIVEATFAAAVAWVIAVRVLHHPQPFFAPAAALIVLGVTRGQRLQRAVEIVLGVALGVLLADLLTAALGRESVAALAVLTALSLSVAILLGGGPILAVQATVSAVYVAVVAGPDHTLGLSRFT